MSDCKKLKATIQIELYPDSVKGEGWFDCSFKIESEGIDRDTLKYLILKHMG